MTAPQPSAAVPDPADVEKVARELYRQWREDSGGDPADLPDWERLNEDCPDEDETDPRGTYRRRAVLVLAAVRPSPDSEAVVGERVEWRYPEDRPIWLGVDQPWPCGRCGKSEDASEKHRCNRAALAATDTEVRRG